MPLSDPAFRAIFEDSPIGICVGDYNLKVIDVNADAFVRASAAAMIVREPCPDCRAKA